MEFVFSIKLGYWLIPTLITIATFIGWRLFGIRMDKSGGFFPDVGGGLLEFGGYLIALVISLIAWLIWALI